MFARVWYHVRCILHMTSRLYHKDMHYLSEWVSISLFWSSKVRGRYRLPKEIWGLYGREPDEKQNTIRRRTIQVFSPPRPLACLWSAKVFFPLIAIYSHIDMVKLYSLDIKSTLFRYSEGLRKDPYHWTELSSLNKDYYYRYYYIIIIVRSYICILRLLSLLALWLFV